jgi:hypothetical protein
MAFPVDFAVVGLPERSGRHILQLPRPAAEAARAALGALLTEELVLPNKTMGKIWEKYRNIWKIFPYRNYRNMIITRKYGKIWKKYGKNMGKIWEKYGKNMEQWWNNSELW